MLKHQNPLIESFIANFVISLGEYAALVIAGVIDLQSSLKLVAHRAKLMMELCQLETTSMLAVNLSAETVRQHIDNNSEFHDLAISCDNSQTDCVVGGPIGSAPNAESKTQYDEDEVENPRRSNGLSYESNGPHLGSIDRSR